MGTQSADFQGYEEILKQHRELKELLARIDQMLEKRAGSGAVVTGLLGLLGGHLAGHFAFEEAGEYFGEALQHAPHLIPQAKELLAEHAQICAIADAIAKEAASTPVTSGWWDSMAAKYKAFQQTLLQHEREEDELLLEVYGRDLGSHD